MFKNALIIVISLIGLSTLECSAQECTAAPGPLAGKYEGPCKKGLAEGFGKAVGEDSYEGVFRSGLPHGKGKYTWKNGDWYDGEWAKGLKQGTGTMHFNITGKDSTLTGFWKKDKYVGLYEKPYAIHKKTVHITDIACQHLNNTLNQVEIFLNSETGGIRAGGGVPPPKPEITDVQIVSGSYSRKIVNDSYGKKIGYRFEDVVFPFRAIYSVNFNKDMFELEISESGKWTVDVRTSF
jgi:hypothetical protein